MNGFGRLTLNNFNNQNPIAPKNLNIGAQNPIKQEKLKKTERKKSKKKGENLNPEEFGISENSAIENLAAESLKYELKLDLVEQQLTALESEIKLARNSGDEDANLFADRLEEKKLKKEEDIKKFREEYRNLGFPNKLADSIDSSYKSIAKIFKTEQTNQIIESKKKSLATPFLSKTIEIKNSITKMVEEQKDHRPRSYNPFSPFDNNSLTQ